MLTKKYLLKIEKETNKRLRKFYRNSAYFYIDRVTFEFGEFEHIVELETRAGFECEVDGKEVSKHISISFTADTDCIRNVGEFATLYYHAVVGKLDEVEYFEVK